MAEFTEDRYGPWMGAIYIVFALCFLIINTGSMLKGAGKVISQATGGGVGVNEIVVAMTVLFMLYSLVGGLVAAAWTDLFQGFLIIVLSFMLIPLGWSVVGGLDGMKGVAGAVPVLARDAVRDRSVGHRDADGQRPGRHHGAAAPDRRGRHRARTSGPAAIGMFYGNFVKRVCTVGWALVGLIVAAMVAQGQAPALARCGGCLRVRVPPAAVPGRARPDDRVDPGRQHVDLLGVPGRQRRAVHRGALPPAARAGPAGSPLSLGRAHQRPRDHHASACCMRSILIQSVLYTFLLTETMATFIGISVLGGILWRRANRWGALASMIGALRRELRALRGDRPAARSLGSERVPRRAAGRDRRAGRSSACSRRRSRRATVGSFFERLETSSDDDRSGCRRAQAAAAGEPAALRRAWPRAAAGACSARISSASPSRGFWCWPSSWRPSCFSDCDRAPVLIKAASERLPAGGREIRSHKELLLISSPPVMHSAATQPRSVEGGRRG